MTCFPAFPESSRLYMDSSPDSPTLSTFTKPSTWPARLFDGYERADVGDPELQHAVGDVHRDLPGEVNEPGLLAKASGQRLDADAEDRRDLRRDGGRIADEARIGVERPRIRGDGERHHVPVEDR